MIDHNVHGAQMKGFQCIGHWNGAGSTSTKGSTVEDGGTAARCHVEATELIIRAVASAQSPKTPGQLELTQIDLCPLEPLGPSM